MFADGMAAILPHARACEGGARGRAAAPDVCGGPRLHLAAVGGARRRATQLGEGAGVVIDAYHLWWDPDLEAQIARAKGRILAHHICDWLVPTKDMLLDRGMMGDGVIDLPGLRRMVEAAGFHGYQEVEIFSAENWWKRPGDEVHQDLHRALQHGVLIIRPAVRRPSSRRPPVVASLAQHRPADRRRAEQRKQQSAMAQADLPGLDARSATASARASGSMRDRSMPAARSSPPPRARAVLPRRASRRAFVRLAARIEQDRDRDQRDDKEEPRHREAGDAASRSCSTPR